MVKFEINLASLYGLKEDGTPKRLSMFPPSYAERAAFRIRQRQALQAKAEAEELAKKSPEKIVQSTKVIDGKQSSNECNHRCLRHNVCCAEGKAQVSQKEQNHKKNSNCTQIDGKDNQTSKDGDEGSKGKDTGDKQKGKGKQQDNKSKKIDKDNQGSKEGEGEESKSTNKWKAKSDKANDSSSPFTNIWAPSAKTYPWAYDLDRWTDQRRALEYAAKGFSDAIDAARRADQDAAEKWLKEMTESVKQAAFSWLQERDAVRHGNVSGGYYSFKPPGFSPVNAKTPMFNMPNVNSIHPPESKTGAFFRPVPWNMLASTGDNAGHDFVQHDKAPMAVYEHGNELYTGDGRKVTIFSKKKVNPAKSNPAAWQRNSGNPAPNEGLASKNQSHNWNHDHEAPHGSNKFINGTDWKNSFNSSPENKHTFNPSNQRCTSGGFVPNIERGRPSPIVQNFDNPQDGGNGWASGVNNNNNWNNADPASGWGNEAIKNQQTREGNEHLGEGKSWNNGNADAQNWSGNRGSGPCHSSNDQANWQNSHHENINWNSDVNNGNHSGTTNVDQYEFGDSGWIQPEGADNWGANEHVDPRCRPASQNGCSNEPTWGNGQNWALENQNSYQQGTDAQQVPSNWNNALQNGSNWVNSNEPNGHAEPVWACNNEHKCAQNFQNDGFNSHPNRTSWNSPYNQSKVPNSSIPQNNMIPVW